ncbi:post-GPI attachment to proteins factor 4-like [Ruditapes philippinarum]|uniref:post-GPI attachment to proteins factor 4-like n=1 Tax=Ruditapes philippinarum TaxID=129788 RepID=UPI00295ABD0C|nr:post-GPI attachment to proteins factor 4-like [Ruditapes philippinarum]
MEGGAKSNKKSSAFLVRCCFQLVTLVSSRHVRLFILMIVILCSIVPFFAIDMPFSKLYERYHTQSETLNCAKKFNSLRLSKALKYFNESYSKTPSSFYIERSRREPEIVVCIITVSRSNSRHETGYLIQTSSVIDSIIKSDTTFKNTLLFVCNVDRNPNKHFDAMFVQSYVPYVNKYGYNSFGKTFYINNFTSNHSDASRRREFEDYIFCLNVSKSFGSPYVLMLEDDVLPYKNVFQILHYTIKQHNLQHSEHLGKKVVPGREFAFLKLYYPERWQGFANEFDKILELFSIGSLGGALMLSVVFLFPSNSGLSYSLKLFYFIFGAFMTMMSVLIIGRHNVISLRRILPQLFVFKPTPGCCTPAMFYSSSVLNDLMYHLMFHSDINKDLAINDFIKQNDIPGYILEPNLFRHIGMYTSLTDAYKPPVEFIFDMP